MSQNLTTKNLYKVFQDIYVNHNGLHDYGTGDIYRVNGRKALKHPTLWVDLFNATLTHNLMTVSARIYVFDVPDQADYAEQDVQSDTLLILNDVITLLRQYYGLIPEDFEATSEFFYHDFSDRVAGWFIEVPLEVPTTYGECDISVDNLTPFPVGSEEDPFSPVISEFLMASPTKLWRITINDTGNLESREVI